MYVNKKSKKVYKKDIIITETREFFFFAGTKCINTL